mmetsp:Transcript_13550/g.20656  ORF Transcript_13550/g.20656 Transcript_13550/m.20656 type:complete len:96 (-) Transcript_13550:493-780(-)
MRTLSGDYCSDKAISLFSSIFYDLVRRKARNELLYCIRGIHFPEPLEGQSSWLLIARARMLTCVSSRQVPPLQSGSATRTISTNNEVDSLHVIIP